MDQAGISRQITSFYKTMYDNSIRAMGTIQDQTEKMVSISLEKLPGLPEQSRNFVNTWVKAYRKGCDDFKTAADAQYKKVDDMFNPGEKVNIKETVNNTKSN